MSGLRDQLEQVRDEFGVLTPKVVVEAARPEDAPLHSRFEWDDTVAAEKWRREQASELIRSVRVSYTAADSEERSVRAYVAVPGEARAASYVPTEVAFDDPFTRQLVLRECEREVAALAAKYRHLQEFAAILTRVAA